MTDDNNSFFRALRGEPTPPDPPPNPGVTWQDHYLHLQAEVKRLRERYEQRVENQVLQEKLELLRSLLPVLDNLERALAQADANTEDSIRTGVELTLRSLRDVFAQNNVTVINPVGQPFNPLYHAAVATVQQDGIAEGTVVAVEQKGYRIEEHLLRPAQVIVQR